MKRFIAPTRWIQILLLLLLTCFFKLSESAPKYPPSSFPTVEPTEEDAATKAEEEAIENDPEIVIVFLFLSLVIGTVITYLISRYAWISDLPYTVVIFLVGVIFGLVHEDPYSAIGQSIAMWYVCMSV